MILVFQNVGDNLPQQLSPPFTEHTNTHTKLVWGKRKKTQTHIHWCKAVTCDSDGGHHYRNKANYFCSAKTKQDSTLCCFLFWDKVLTGSVITGLLFRQTTRARAVLPPCAKTNTFFISDEMRQKDERCSGFIVADDK